MPSTSVHFGLSTGNGELDTAIRSSPQAAAFWLRKVKRSRVAFLGNSIMKVVSPSLSAQLTVLPSTNAAADSCAVGLTADTGENFPSGEMHSICAGSLTGPSA